MVDARLELARLGPRCPAGSLSQRLAHAPRAQRLVADGEPVVDVPAKLSARVRVFSTGQGRKTDATDAGIGPIYRC